MRRAAGAVALLILSGSIAHAHIVIPGVGGFTGGVLHPLLVLSHLLALIALGLLAGLQPLPMRLAIIATFAVAMILSFGMVSLAYSTGRAEFAVLALAAITGLLLAAWPRASGGIGAGLAALIATAILFDSVPAVPSIGETTLALAGTLAATITVVTVTAFLSAALPAFWPSVGVRVAGSWIAASAILVLALRLAKL